MSAIILLVALILALAAEEKIEFSDSENITSAEIKELQKKKTEELTEEDNENLANLPVLQEIQTLAQNVNNKEDLDKKVYEEHKRWMTDKNKYIEEKTDEFFKTQKDRLKTLEEENKQLAKALETENDPQKKAQILEQIKSNRTEMSEIRREIAEHINQINKNFTEIGRKGFATQEQFQTQSQSPSLGSYRN
ncbi:45127_t:CDS:2 [Gigaspora margarita]|uniref:45127_t:CDS:1 n=1 Tax=Gigaspora margarita TaxID=4874 RepID=A0ABN7UH48_GIGMA|nr:45127_t:CDS:2 [Gigaspora margarita]